MKKLSLFILFMWVGTLLNASENLYIDLQYTNFLGDREAKYEKTINTSTSGEEAIETDSDGISIGIGYDIELIESSYIFSPTFGIGIFPIFSNEANFDYVFFELPLLYIINEKVQVGPSFKYIYFPLIYNNFSETIDFGNEDALSYGLKFIYGDKSIQYIINYNWLVMDKLSYNTSQVNSSLEMNKNFILIRYAYTISILYISGSIL